MTVPTRSALSSIDLNLLGVLDALLREPNTTRAARTLGVTQSAVSQGLAKLRRLLDDDLFIRRASGLEPTVYAHSIAPAVRSIVAQLNELFAPLPPFDPQTSERTFLIEVAPGLEPWLAPPLVAAALAQAPGVRLRFQAGDSASMVAVDLAIYAGRASGDYDAVVPLGAVPFVCMVGANESKVSLPLSREAYLSGRHIELGALRPEFADEAGEGREVCASVADLATLSTVLATGSYLATIPAVLAPLLSAQAIKVPVPVRPTPLGLAWRNRSAPDAGHDWLLDLVRICVPDAHVMQPAEGDGDVTNPPQNVTRSVHS